jgi:hypothetical protein
MENVFEINAKKIHGDKYCYENISYINMKTPIKLICDIHGKFTVTPSNHIYYKKGCNICEKENKKEKAKTKFIEKAKEIHGDKYSYKLVQYINSKSKIDIICPEHGIFKQEPRIHSQGHGCKKCQKYDYKKYIKECNIIHGNKYDYSLVNLNNIKINIICPIHGNFNQNKYNHKKGHGCKKCDFSYKLDKKSFIEKSRKIHGNKYDYSKVEYINSETNIKIICPEHGEFKQTPANHTLRMNGCPSCSENKKYTTETFIEKSKSIHGDKYDYSEVNYKNSTTKVNIICQKHGIFKQRPASHLIGYGCKKCADNFIDIDEYENYKEYRLVVRRLTNQNKKDLFKNWDGKDYYDNEYIKENLNLDPYHKNYPTIDHKIPIIKGFLENIDPNNISSLDNLCITKRTINSSKQHRDEKEYIIGI